MNTKKNYNYYEISNVDKTISFRKRKQKLLKLLLNTKNQLYKFHIIIHCIN